MRAHLIINTVLILCMAFIISLLFWHAPMRLFLAHVPPGWALFLGVLVGVIVGVSVGLYYGSTSRYRQDREILLILVYSSLGAGILTFALVILEINSYFHATAQASPQQAQLLGEVIFKAYFCTVSTITGLLLRRVLSIGTPRAA